MPNSILRYIPIVLALLFCNLCLVATADEKLQTLTSQVCDFQIDMPANPTDKTTDPNSSLVKHVFESANPGISLYQVSYDPGGVNDEKIETVEQWDAFGKATSKEVETGMGAKKTSSKMVDHSGMLGFEIDFDITGTPSVSGRMRFFNVITKDKRSQIYSLFVLGRADFMKSENVKQFFASFKILSAQETTSSSLETMVNKVCDFQIDMLPNPKHDFSDVNSAKANHTFTSAIPGTGAYLVEYRYAISDQKHPETAEEWQAELGNFVKSIEENSKGITKYSKVINHNGMFAYEIGSEIDQAQNLSSIMRVFVVMVNKTEAKTYAILAIGKPEFLESENTQQFFRSFKVITPPPATKTTPVPSNNSLTKMVSDVCEFEIEMFPNPKHDSPEPGSKKSTHSFHSRMDDNGVYVVHYGYQKRTDEDPTTADDWEWNKEKIVKQMNNSPDGKVLYSKVINSAGLPGMEFAVAIDKDGKPFNKVIMRVFFVKENAEDVRRYIVVATGTPEFVDSERTGRVLNSFKIIKPGTSTKLPEDSPNMKIEAAEKASEAAEEMLEAKEKAREELLKKLIEFN